MKYADLAESHIINQPTYEPGKPIQDVARELGLQVEAIEKLASNESSWGPSARVREVLQQELSSLHLYPDGSALALRTALADHWHLAADQFILGNGSNEIIEQLAKLFVRPGVEVVMGEDSFPIYRLVTLLYGGTPVPVAMPEHTHDLPAMLAAVTDRTGLLFLPSPNNPTGTANTAAQVRALVEGLPDHVVLCLDEAYAEYLPEGEAYDVREAWALGKKVVALRTFSKIYALAALRVGYAYGDAELIALLQKVRQPFHVNSLAQAAACAALADQQHVAFVRQANAANRQYLYDLLLAEGLEPVSSLANFVLVPVPDARALFAALQQEGLIVRPIVLASGVQYVRITVAERPVMDRLVQVLTALLASRPF